MLLPPSCDLALKEWAVACRALSLGKQILILRKGGIHKDDKEFRVVHPDFLLYPTYEHQKPDLLDIEYHQDLREVLGENDVPGLVTLSHWCQVTDKFEVRDEERLAKLSPFHVWTADYAQSRLHWRPKQPLMVVLLRAYALQQPQALPILDEYAGCKSWVELGQDVPLGYMKAVQTDEEHEAQALAIREALDTV